MRLGNPEFVPFRVINSTSLMRKKKMRKMLERVDTVYIIKYKILGVSAEITAQNRIPFLVVIHVPVTLVTISKCQ